MFTEHGGGATSPVVTGQFGSDELSEVMLREVLAEAERYGNRRCPR